MNLKKKNTFIRLAVPVGVFLLAASSNALALPGDESFKSDVATEDCFFAPAVSSDMNWNYVYADSNAVYQCSSFDLEAGDVLEIKGKYPRARYLSWTYYGTNGGQQLIDIDIQPDAGSENPFINGTQRCIAASDSSYTINICEILKLTLRNFNQIKNWYGGLSIILSIYYQFNVIFILILTFTFVLYMFYIVL